MNTRAFLFLLVLMLELLPVRAYADSPVSDPFGNYSCSPSRVNKPNPVLDGFGVYSSASFKITGPGMPPRVQALAVQQDGKIVVGGDFTITGGGQTRRNLARIKPDGTLDTDFLPLDLKLGLNPAPVSAIALQPDPNDPTKDLIIIGGSFSSVTSTNNNTNRNGLVRIKSDGSLDIDFNPATTPNPVHINVITLWTDDKGIPKSILVGGSFPEIKQGDPSPNFANISLGSPDIRPPGWTYSAGINGEVNAILLQDDGLTLVGGNFNTTSKTPQSSNIARFKATGDFDDSFGAPSPGGTIRSMAQQADGKIIIGGDFVDFGKPGRNYLARLKRIGTLDDSLNVSFNQIPNGRIASIVVQPDGNILAAGAFNQIGSPPTASNYLARLKIDGTFDSTLDPTLDYVVNVIARQPDGKILAGGDFTHAEGKHRAGLVRFYAEGELDDDLPGITPDGNVTAISLRPDGTTTVAGTFAQVGAAARNHIARFTRDWKLADSPLSIGATVNMLAPLPDNGLVVGGTFSVPQRAVVQLDGDGNIPADILSSGYLFNNSMLGLITGSGKLVQAMALPNQNEIYIGGKLTGTAISTSNLLKRTAKGEPVNGFAANSPSGIGTVYSIAVESGNSVLVGAGSAPGKMLRLDADNGNVIRDWQFSTGSGSVNSIALQHDEQIIAAGAFNSLYQNPITGAAWNRNIVRIINDPNSIDYGKIDDNFNIETTYSRDLAGFTKNISRAALQADGKMLIYGVFDKVKDAKGLTYCRDFAARINPDGSLDPSFDLGSFPSVTTPIGQIYSVNLQPDGKVIIGGEFGGASGLTGTNARKLARFSNGAASQELTVSKDGSTITWLRGGTAPELWRVWFEDSGNPDAPPEEWIPVTGNLQRIPNTDALGKPQKGGWKLEIPATSLPRGANRYLRARGYVAGDKGSAGSLVESVRNYYRKPLASVTPDTPANPKTYGEPDPSFTGTLEGFLAADNVTATCSRTPGEHVKASPDGYTISATLEPEGVLGDYEITYNTAKLYINQKDAYVWPTTGMSKPYGSLDPTFTGKLEGFLDIDHVTATYSRTPKDDIVGNPYIISATLSPPEVLGNYRIHDNTAPFIITPANVRKPQTITFGLPAKTFGDGDFPLERNATPSGLAVDYGIPDPNLDAASNPDVATINGNMVHILEPKIHDLNPMTTHIKASQAGNDEYSPASDVVQTLKVNPPPGHGLSFDGFDDLVWIGVAPQLNFGSMASFSIETWLHLPDDPPPDGGLVSKGKGGGAGGGYQLLLHQGRIAAEIGDGTLSLGVPEGLVGTSSLNDGQWHHVALSVDRASATASLYLDGRLEAKLSNPALGVINLDNAQRLQVGVDRSGTHFFKGEIDELRIWATARDIDDIRRTVSRIVDPLDSKEPNLAAYFHFDEGDAGPSNASFTSAPERTANGANGTLRGFALSGDASNWIRSGAFLPLLETAPISLVTASAAASGGVVYPNYYPPTDRGLCWGSAPNPGLGDTCSHQGAGVGEFTAAIAGLIPGASYHVRGFATNGMGTAYGNDLSFQTARLDLKVTADDKVRAFGAPNPQLTASYMGFVNGENPTLAGITGSPVLWTDATQASPVGSYDIKVSLGTLIASNYNFIPKTGTLTVIKSCQEIVFPPIGERTFGDPPFEIRASACSGLGITFAGSDPKVAQINGTTLTITGAGVVVITASQGGSGNLDRAPDVPQTVVVHRSGQALGFSSLAGKVLGDPPFTLNATASSGLPVSYQSSDASVAEVNGNTVTLKGAGTAVITARQPGNGNYNEALPVSQPLTVASEGGAPLLALSMLSSGAVTANPVLNIMGTASDASGIASLTVNGADLTGRAALFSSAVPLGIGENSIEVTARDGAGNRTTETLSITLDAAAPEISLAAPADNSVSSAPLFTASGAVTPESEVTMGVNGSALQILSVTDGAFTGSGYLEPGVNTIEVSAALSGRLSRVKRSVTLAPGKPSVAITVPVEDIRTEHESITLRGTVEGEGCRVALDVAGRSFSPAVQAGGFRQVIALDHTGEFPITASVTDTGGNSSVAQRNIIRVDRILGDLNGDGCVDIRDALAVLRISFGIDQATAGALAHGDVAPLVNGVPQPDGRIDVGDLLVLLRKVVGLVDF